MLLFMTISFQMFPDCVLGPGIWVMGNGKCNFIFGFWWLGGDSHPHLHLLQPVWLQFSPQGAARVHCSHTLEDWPVIAKDEEPGPGLWASEGLYSPRTPGKKKVGVSTVAKEKGKTAGGEGTPPSPRSTCHTIYRTKVWASRTETIIAFCQRKTDGARRVAHLCSPAPQSYAQWG